jgi:Effector-associated domain 4/Bacterial TniB protein
MGSYWSDNHKEQTKCILQTLVYLVLENIDADGVKYSEQNKDTNDPDLIYNFETTLRGLLDQIKSDKNNPDSIRSNLNTDTLSRLLGHLFKFKILSNNRVATRGSKDWLFSLHLVTRSVEKNVSRLSQNVEDQWDKHRPQKSKDRGAKSKEANDMAPSPDARIQSNPFCDTGQISDPNRFYGREELLRQLLEQLSNGNSLSLVGKSTVGKSSILRMICDSNQARSALPPEQFTVLYLDMQIVSDGEDFYTWLCEKAEIPYCRGTQLEWNLKSKDKRFILCLDEIDSMAGKKRFQESDRRQLRGLADGSDKPLTLVTASQAPLKEVFPASLERSSPLADLCQQIDVQPFSDREARGFLAERLRETGVSFSNEQIDKLLEISGCNPGRLQSFSATLYNEIRTKRS